MVGVLWTSLSDFLFASEVGSLWRSGYWKLCGIGAIDDGHKSKVGRENSRFLFVF